MTLNRKSKTSFLACLVALACGTLAFASTNANSATNLNSNISAVASTSALSTSAVLCPFCSSINPTIAEQLDTNDVVVVAKLIEQAPEADIDAATLPKATFEVSKVLKGEAHVKIGDSFKTVLIGQHELEDSFMVMGVDVPSPAWTTPIRTNQRVVDYFEKIPTLPISGPDRLAFFQDFFEDEEMVLANDAYDEFALAPYEDVIALKDRMKHDQIVAWIKDEDVTESHKRLYFTMLGICGTKDDVDMLESMLAEEDREKRPGLDAMAACYLRIRKAEGLPFIEKLYLANREAEYIDVFSVIQALRFHSTETEDISKERIAQSLRLVLDHPDVADIVIPDLARLKDWSVMDKLKGMFENAAGPTKWVHTPIASYMQECPLEEAKVMLEEFRKIDAEAVQRAELMANFELFDDEDEEEEEEDEDSDDNNDSSEKSDRIDDDQVSLNGNEDHVQRTDKDLNENTNMDESTYVSTLKPSIDSEGESSALATVTREQASEGRFTVEGRKPQSTSVATPLATTVDAPLWVILGVAMLFCVGIFFLLWSVINGWFERLIF